MIIQYIRYKLESTASANGTPPAASFETAYAVAASALDSSPHCLGYELSRCMEEPDQYILRIEWDSLEGHLSGFRRSKHFQPFLDAIKPYIGSIEEMLHYELTSVVSADCNSTQSGDAHARGGAAVARV
jgi:quinol monooxygenase YgiN